MSDTTRRPAPYERGALILVSPPHAIPTDNRSTVYLTHTSWDTNNVTKTTATLPTDPPSLTPNAHTFSRTPTLRDLVNALDTSDYLVAPMVAALPNNWSEINSKGTIVTKQKLEQCIWGAHTESDSLQTLQQAIITGYPPTHTHVTQYTAYLTSVISRDSTVWRHTIMNACQGHILPHSLHNPINIFNIYHNSHFTTLITDSNTYSYYDSNNFRHPHTTHRIHNTLRQW